MPNRAVRIVALACLGLLAATACSDDRLSKEEFIEQADAVCATVNERTEELGEPTTQESFPEFARKAKEITDEALEDMRALEPPEEDEERIDEMLDAIEKAASFLPEIADAVAENDPERMRDIGLEVQSAAQKASTIAEEYGFEECGRSSLGS